MAANSDRLAGLLREEKDALDDLAQEIAGLCAASLSKESRTLLMATQRVEEALDRIELLESERIDLSSRMKIESGDQMCVVQDAGNGCDPSGAARILELRQQVVQTVTGIAIQNSAAGHLLDGLVRITGAAAVKLIRLQEVGGPSLLAAQGGARGRAVSLDVQA